MPLLIDAVERLHQAVQDTGCADQTIILQRAPDAAKCQYNRGVCIQANFGGRTGYVATDSPIEVTTKVSFMFGATLTAPRQKTAAVAIINAICGFLLMVRKLRACKEECYGPCLSRLKDRTSGSSLYAVGRIAMLDRELSSQMVSDPTTADIILVSADGILSDQGLTTLEECRGKKKILFLGPSTVGLSALLCEEHWCPYGR